MSIVHQIVQRHAGTIEVNSEEGSGVEFHITLPLDPLGRTQL
jgi:signal transduction histidine kinase